MTVSVAQPTPPPSPLDSLMKALSVAQTIYGVGVEKHKIDALAKQQGIENEQKAGALARQKEQDELAFNEKFAPSKGKYAFSTPGKEGTYEPRADILKREELAAKGGKNPEKEDKLIDDLGKALEKDINPNSTTRSGIKQYKEKMDAADRLRGLYTDYSTGGIKNLNPQQMEEMAMSANFMLANGRVTEGGRKSFVPDSAKKDVAGMKQWLFNEPFGTDQQAFTKQMAETTERERQIAEDQLRSAQASVLPAHRLLKNKDPQQFNAILLGQGIDPANDFDEKGHYKKHSPIYGRSPAKKIIGVHELPDIK